MSRVALRNVRVFDGRELTEPRTVVIDGPVLGSEESGAEVVDGAGGVLLPGFIDAHLHPRDRDALDRLLAHGVTTGLAMATWPAELLAELRAAGGTEIRSAGTPAIGAGGPHAKVPGMAESAVVRDPAQAPGFVADRLAEGADYLKLVLEGPGEGGPSEAVARALTDEAHARGLSVVAHATVPEAYTLGLDIGADVLTHVPLGRPVTDADVARMAADGRVVVPTLVMMEGVAETMGVPDAYRAAESSVGAMHAAGVPVLAGSDANDQPGIPFQPAFGESLHRELELLVAAGLTTVDAVRAATCLPAEHFGLTDRGVVEPGKRADLVLLDGDPLADIRATRAIRRSWLGGVEQ
ncbi:amidohydrolase family protein [Amycolatopsis sp. 195334CR]|uniref:amidohydrolase family protein n=1 Tax=Amycolatopsis sp. 195334CR TaxID=2814588 RepID=UPI001F5C0BBD|nr:amidohydrolase family protein [Amycolatopsis sp. 195334CR]